MYICIGYTYMYSKYYKRVVSLDSPVMDYILIFKLYPGSSLESFPNFKGYLKFAYIHEQYIQLQAPMLSGYMVENMKRICELKY